MLRFIRQFLSHPLKTGAVSGPSQEVANWIVNAAHLSNAKTVVELGPGTGVFTEKILERISDDTLFFAVEINPFFVKETKKRCPNAIVYEDSGLNMRKYLKKHGVDGCDCIISGLPWSCFEEELQENMLQAVVDALNPRGEFLASGYLPGALFSPVGKKFRNMLHDKFDKVSISKILWKNIPPYLAFSLSLPKMKVT